MRAELRRISGRTNDFSQQNLLMPGGAVINGDFKNMPVDLYAANTEVCGSRTVSLSGRSAGPSSL